MSRLEDQGTDAASHYKGHLPDKPAAPGTTSRARLPVQLLPPVQAQLGSGLSLEAEIPLASGRLEGLALFASFSNGTCGTGRHLLPTARPLHSGGVQQLQELHDHRYLRQRGPHWRGWEHLAEDAATTSDWCQRHTSHKSFRVRRPLPKWYLQVVRRLWCVRRILGGLRKKHRLPRLSRRFSGEPVEQQWPDSQLGSTG